MPEYGQLIQDEDRALLEYKRRLNHPTEKVWRALTDPPQEWEDTYSDGRG